MATRRVYNARIAAMMASRGQPIYGQEGLYADMYRAALKVGLTEKQASCILSDAYKAAKRYEWDLAAGSALQYATREKQAEECPNGKWAWVRDHHPMGIYAREEDTLNWASEALVAQKVAS